LKDSLLAVRWRRGGGRERPPRRIRRGLRPGPASCPIFLWDCHLGVAVPPFPLKRALRNPDHDDRHPQPETAGPSNLPCPNAFSIHRSARYRCVVNTTIVISSRTPHVENGKLQLQILLRVRRATTEHGHGSRRRGYEVLRKSRDLARGFRACGYN